MLQIASLLGIPIGKIINKYTQEELQQGAHYFRLAYKATCATIGIYLLILYPYFLPVLLGIILSYICKEDLLYAGLATTAPLLPILCLNTILTTLRTTQTKILKPTIFFLAGTLIAAILNINLIPIAAGALLARSFK